MVRGVQGGVALARRASTPAVGFLLGVLTWRAVNFTPVDSLDPSWQVALHMAAHRHLSFDQVVFTFGPLGFLTQPVAYYPWTGLLSALYGVVLQTSLCAALVGVLRRPVGLAGAAVAAFVLVSATRQLKAAEVVVVVVVVVAFGLLRGDHTPRTERILVVVGGVVAGTHVLVKFNTGVTVAVVAGVAAWFVGRRGWRSEGTFMGAALGSMVAGWILTGNHLSDLVPFLRRSLAVASGYSESMGIELGGRAVFYPLAALATGLVIAMGWTASRGWPLPRRVALGLAGAMWLYAALKHGFVRHDEHDIVFFGEVLLVGAGLAGASAPSSAGIRKWLPAVGAVVLLVAYLMSSEIRMRTVVDPRPALRRAGSDTLTMALPGRRTRIVEKARAELRRFYGLAPSTVALLSGQTVHIRPWEASVAWAFPEIRWRPMPVFQEYSAYTADLDRINAAFIDGPRAPERILTEQITVDIRNPDWESPAAFVAVVCHYRELAAQTHWQVLGRVDDRCGPERPLGTLKAHTGDIVEVPDNVGRDELIVAHIRGLDPSPLYGLRSTLWRVPPVHVTVDGGQRYRLVPGTAADGLIVRAPARLGFSQPFAPDSTTTFQVTHDGGIGLGSDLTIEFVAISVVN